MKKQLLLLIMMLLPMVAWADDSGTCGEKLTYFFKDATMTLTINGSGDMKDYGWFEYNYIPTPWESYKDKIETIILEEGVTCIGRNAFSECSGLTSVTIPNSVTSIGNYAFYGCSALTSVTIPNSVTSIEISAFYGCSALTSVEIPNSVTSIGDEAFNGCSSLTTISIPNSVTYIGEYAFEYTGWYNSQDDGALYLSNWLVAYKGEVSEGTLTIPEGVIGVGKVLTYNKTITNIVFPQSLLYLYANAFGIYSIYTSDVSKTITFKNINPPTIIGGSHFSNNLLTVIVPFNSYTTYKNSNVWKNQNIVEQPYKSNGLYYNSLGDNKVYVIKSQDQKGYSGDIDIPENIDYEGTSLQVTEIASQAFRNYKGLKTITIPNSVTSIGTDAFYGCSGLTSVTIGNSVTSIGGWAFYGCTGLTNVTIPNSVTSISGNAFYGCTGLTTVTIPNSVTSIGGNAFYGCTGLTTVTIPNSVTSIGGYAFYGCNNLMTVKSKILEPFSCNNVFSTETQRNGILYVPEGTMSLYTRFDGWREFLKIEELSGELKKYQLSFVVNNQELSSQELEFGAKITPPETDSKGNKIDWYKYPTTMPEHDLVVYGMTLKGDVNGDGIIDIADAVKIVNIVVGKE